MGEALLGGLLAAGTLRPEQIAVVEIDPARRDHLVDRFPGVTVVDAPEECQGLIVATKPADVGPAVAAASRAGVERIVSIAAGVSTGSIESAAGRDVPVVRAMPNTPALVGAGVIVDLGARIVRLDGEEISLRAKEFDLLVALMSNQGNVVTREDLMAQVWDEHWFGSTKTLDVHISALRRRLGEAPGESSRITALRGVGYRWERDA